MKIEINPYNNVCPSLSDLEKLLAGEIDESRARLMKDHISKCRDCCDLYESLMEYSDNYNAATEQRIHSRIDGHIASLQKKNPRVIPMLAKYAAAASIVGLGIWAFAYMGSSATDSDTQHTDLAITNTENPNQENTVVPDGQSNQQSMSSEQNTVISDGQENPGDHKQLVARGPKSQKNANSETSSQEPAASETFTSTLADKASTNAASSTRSLVVDKDDSAQANNPEVEKLMANAIALYNSGKYSEARLAFDEVIDKQPSNRAYKYLGLCNMNMKFYRRAIDNFKHVTPANDAEAQEIQQLIDKCKE